MKPRTLRTIAIGLIWTGLAAWAGWSIYENTPKGEQWLSIVLVSIIVIAYFAVLLKPDALPRALCAILWLILLLFGVASIIASIVAPILPRIEALDWALVSYFGVLLTVWLYVVCRWNSFAAVGNAYYAFVWYWVVLCATACVPLIVIVPFPLPGGLLPHGDPAILLGVRALVVWVLLVCLRIPWRYPWLLLLPLSALLLMMVLLGLGIAGSVVTAIGLSMLIVQAIGKRNVLARSRLKAGPISIPTRGLVEYDA